MMMVFYFWFIFIYGFLFLRYIFIYGFFLFMVGGRVVVASLVVVVALLSAV